MTRSIAAIVAGFLLIGFLSFGTDALVRGALPTYFDAVGRTEHAGILLATIAYVGLYAVTGCYVAARLAPRAPMRHALILGALGLVFNVAGTIAMWATAPAWYHIVSLALVMPYAWLGGRLRERELRGTPALRTA